MQSTAVASVGYDPHSQILEVRYISGDLYAYLEVPAAVYDALLEAPSAGAFVNQEIKPFYRYNKLRSGAA